MSLIGTRPPTLDEFEQYETFYKRRLSIRPGITGMWQATGRSDITDFEEVLALDLEYIDNWSFSWTSMMGFIMQEVFLAAMKTDWQPAILWNIQDTLTEQDLVRWRRLKGAGWILRRI